MGLLRDNLSISLWTGLWCLPLLISCWLTVLDLISPLKYGWVSHFCLGGLTHWDMCHSTRTGRHFGIHFESVSPNWKLYIKKSIFHIFLVENKMNEKNKKKIYIYIYLSIKLKKSCVSFNQYRKKFPISRLPRGGKFWILQIFQVSSEFHWMFSMFSPSERIRMHLDLRKGILNLKCWLPNCNGLQHKCG